MWVTFAQADVLERDALTKKSEIAIFPAQIWFEFSDVKSTKKLLKYFLLNFFSFSVLNYFKIMFMYFCFKINSNKIKIFHLKHFKRQIIFLLINLIDIELSELAVCKNLFEKKWEELESKHHASSKKVIKISELKPRASDQLLYVNTPWKKFLEFNFLRLNECQLMLNTLIKIDRIQVPSRSHSSSKFVKKWLVVAENIDAAKQQLDFGLEDDRRG